MDGCTGERNIKDDVKLNLFVAGSILNARQRLDFFLTARY